MNERIRNCPRCGIILEYKSPQSFYYAKKLNNMCRSCSSKEKNNRPHVKLKMKIANSGKKYPSRSEKMKGSNNPNFGNVGYWFGKKRSTSTIQKMKAIRAGFSSYDEYIKLYPAKKRYKSDVMLETYRQLRTNPPLENFHLRGRRGVEGAYQIDHIIGIEEGFDNGIDPSIIGNIKNLKMIPWKENITKYWKTLNKLKG